MPRINFEDSLSKDGRYIALVEEIGRFKAAGMMYYAWSLAQGFWVHGKLIPTEIWASNKFSDFLFTFKLAEVREEGIYVAGSEEQFAWLVAQRANGKKGGRPPLWAQTGVVTEMSKNNSDPNEINNISKAKRNPNETHSKPSLLSSPFSLLSSQKKEEEGESPKRAKPTPKPKAPSSASALPPLAQIWNEYRGPLAGVKGCSGTRKKLADARWREDPDEDYWRGIIERVVASPFCTGDNDRSWKADFDFLVKPDTRHKIEEGKYDQRSGPRGDPPPHVARQLQAELDEIESYKK